MTSATPPVFYTVREAAAILRVAPSTLYRSIRENAFPAVRLRTRYVVPAKAVERLVQEVLDSGALIDIADVLTKRREQAEFRRRYPSQT
jgi:excisionase family DNA binding protein